MNAPFARVLRAGSAGFAILALLAADPPRATANKIKQSVWEYSVKYPSDAGGKATAEYARVTVDKLTKDAFDPAKSSAYIIRPTIGGPFPFVLINVPIRLYQSAQAVPPKPGQLEVRLPRDPKKPDTAVPTFEPGDTVFFRVALKPDAPADPNRAGFKVSNLLWRDGDGGAGANNTVATTKLAGGRFVADPVYAATNDLSSSDYPSTALSVGNLSFTSNAPESVFLGPSAEQAALDLYAASQVPFNPATAYPLSSGQEKMFVDPFAEPDPGNYSGAQGLVYDPDAGGVVGAFRHGYTVTPEPGVWAWAAGGAGWAAGAWYRLRRRAARAGLAA